MRMNHLWKIVLATAVAFVWMAAPPGGAYAQSNFDEWDRTTIVTFNEPVQIGGRVLPAGDYRFRVVDLRGNRQVVRITSVDETAVYGTVIGNSDFRSRAAVSGKCEITFYEADFGAPKSVRSWFYHGRQSGIEFPPPTR